MPLAPLAELASAARRGSLIMQARQLAEWVGERRHVTATGVLRRADAEAAMWELGLSRDGTPLATARVRSARDMPELHGRWRVARVTGMLDVDGRRVGPGATLQAFTDDGGDHDVLGAWEGAFRAAIELDFGDGEEPGSGFVFGDVLLSQIPGVLTTLYVEQVPLALEDLSAHVSTRQLIELGIAPDAGLADTAARGFVDWLILLAGLGAIELHEDAVGLTPLGIWAVHRVLGEMGFDAPKLGDLAEASAEELLERLAAYDANSAEAEVAAWVERRTSEGAARELLDTARYGEPSVRGLVFSLLETVTDAEAVPALRQAIDDPVLRPYVVTWLDAHDYEPGTALTSHEIAWMTADVCAALLVDPQGMALHVQDLGPPELQERLVTDMWRVDHPRAADVLTAIGSYHPNTSIAKAARKAAFRARSRHT
ncbi:MAG: hypothetical protein ACRDN9_08770 [Streptosporangiaceae bacterium]